MDDMTQGLQTGLKAKQRLNDLCIFVVEVLHKRFTYLFVGIILVYGVAVWLATKNYGGGLTLTSNLYSNPLHYSIRLFVVGFIGYRAFYIMIFERPKRLTLTILADLKGYFFNSRRLLNALPIIILLPVFFSLFTSAKNLIPIINPFSWDPVFAEVDRMIHFGQHPWEWLHPILGVALLTCIVSFLYKTWFFAKFMVCIWQAFSLKRQKLREQFFLTFLGAWIINGTLLALLFSSAGPCYFGDVYPDLANPYQGLMEFIRQADTVYKIPDLFAMDYLWDAYDAKAGGIFSGISAMPSMHVSVAFIFMMLGWRVNRFLGIFFTAFLVMTMIGSVHLGWHYAVDGYLSILTTWLLWQFIGRWIGVDEDEGELQPVKVLAK